jgi:hypothetical protein
MTQNIISSMLCKELATFFETLFKGFPPDASSCFLYLMTANTIHIFWLLLNWWTNCMYKVFMLPEVPRSAPYVFFHRTYHLSHKQHFWRNFTPVTHFASSPKLHLLYTFFTFIVSWGDGCWKCSPNNLTFRRIRSRVKLSKLSRRRGRSCGCGSCLGPGFLEP